MTFAHFAVERIVDPDHPALAGHFPQVPLLPAVVILDEIAVVVAEYLPGVHVEGFPIVKLRRPLRPGDRFIIEIRSVTEKRLKLRCFHHGDVVVLGEIDVGHSTTLDD